jgi:hypothetical protein
MKIWKCVSVLVLSVFMVAIMAACGGGSPGATTLSGVQAQRGTSTLLTIDSRVNGATTQGTAGAQKAGGCTDPVNCQDALVSVSPHQVAPGGKVTVTGKGWVANAKLQASIGTQAVESDIVYATSDKHGNFSVVLTIDPQSRDFGPTIVHINLPTDSPNNLGIRNQLSIVE